MPVPDAPWRARRDADIHHVHHHLRRYGERLLFLSDRTRPFGPRYCIMPLLVVGTEDTKGWQRLSGAGPKDHKDQALRIRVFWKHGRIRANLALQFTRISFPI